MGQSRLMETPSQFVLSRLSRDLYIDFLDEAKKRGFSFVCFEDFLGNPTLPSRYILLRHDIDFAPAYSLQMAELEHAAGISSTFFVLVDGPFYVHVGHNVRVATGASLTASVTIAGSALIAEDAWLGVNSSVRDGRRVGYRAFVGMDASVQQDLPDDAVARAPRPDIRLRSD